MAIASFPARGANRQDNARGYRATHQHVPYPMSAKRISRARARDMKLYHQNSTIISRQDYAALFQRVSHQKESRAIRVREFSRCEIKHDGKWDIARRYMGIENKVTHGWSTV